MRRLYHVERPNGKTGFVVADNMTQVVNHYPDSVVITLLSGEETEEKLDIL